MLAQVDRRVLAQADRRVFAQVDRRVLAQAIFSGEVDVLCVNGGRLASTVLACQVTISHGSERAESTRGTAP